MSQICPHPAESFKHHPVLRPFLHGAEDEMKRQEKTRPALTELPRLGTYG